MSHYQLRYNVKTDIAPTSSLPPIRLSIEGGGAFRLQDYLTPSEAAQLGAALSAAALKLSRDDVRAGTERVRVTGRPVGVEPDSPNDWPDPDD